MPSPNDAQPERAVDETCPLSPAGRVLTVLFVDDGDVLVLLATLRAALVAAAAGSDEATAITTAVTAASGNTTSFSATGMRLGRNYDGTVFTECEIYGLIGRKTIFDATELANAKRWLGTKVGLAL